ncbi:MAG UNVERIFIED_CONTAM: TIGR02594 family protein [Methylobacterium ajmalii]
MAAPDGTPIAPASLAPVTDPATGLSDAIERAAQGAYVGRATFNGSTATLNGQTFTGPASPDQVARKFEGFSENDPQQRQALTAFLSKAAGKEIDPQKIPWCAAFVDAVLDASGKPKRGSLMAVDFLDYGTATEKPTKGDVVVFKSMAAGSSGHVGFVVGIEGDRVRYIAGNDDNKVQEDTLPLSKVAGFRHPPEAGTALPEPGSSPTQSGFARALTSAEPTQGNYTLAVIKDNPKAARILDFVAGPESRGNYNAYFANAGSTEDLSKRTLDQTIEWSQSRGTKSSATGRYQFMAATLKDLKSSMGLKGSEPFTPELQDRMAVALLERRGFSKWQAGKITDAQFANNLALEWASLPNVTAQNGRQAGQSAYAGDGLNKSLVTPDQVLGALRGSGALPGAQLAQAAQQAVKKPGLVERAKRMFGIGTAPAPEAAQSPVKPVPLPAPVKAAHDQVLAGLEPDVAAVVRRAQADNPNLRLAPVAGRGGYVTVRRVDASGQPTQSGDEVGAALQRAAGQLGVGVNFANGTLTSTKKTTRA